ncbi:hypothetical protein JXL21_05955 [Candidatus Bathyarchaeota archaeon]|nr:hypothetical protein [Candidatus Bathyarchaeota archaeon]
MKRQWLVLGVALILGVTLFIQYYAELRYPVEEISVDELPVLVLGEYQSYRVIKEGEAVGTHRYAVTGKEGSGDDVRYTMRSTTDINYEGDSLHLVSVYVFDGSLRPLSYSLNVTRGDELTIINSEFSPSEVTTTVNVMGEAVELTESAAENMYVVENSMPSYWEILFQSTSLKPGRRHQANFFVPQSARVVAVSLVVDGDTSTLRVGGRDLECTVIKESELGLVFYLYEGELVQFRDDAQELTLEKIF